MARGGKRQGAGRKPGSKNKPKAEEAEKRPRPAISLVEETAPPVEGVPFGEPDWSLTWADILDRNLAHRIWFDVITELRDTEKLAKVNIYTVERYVHFSVLHQQALRKVAEEGAVFPRRGKKSPAWNPWFTVLKDASAMASSLEAELTITPRRRNNGGKVPKKNRPQGGAVTYLRSLSK